MKRALSVLLILLLLFSLCACKESEPVSEESFFEVSYSTELLPYEAAAPAAERVKKGEKATAPTLEATPSAGKAVVWTLDATDPVAFDFSAPVEGDLLLYAVEVFRTYKITYLVEHGSAKAPDYYTKDTETFSLTRANADFGYKFYKWSYFDDRDSAVAEIEKGTEGDIVLRADIRPNTYVIQYEDDGESNPNPSEYVFGTTLSLRVPQKAGYRFKYFTLNGDPTEPVVTELTAEFILQHKAAIFYDKTAVEKNGSDIYLLAIWEKEE